jgi:hypothetical protein
MSENKENICTHCRGSIVQKYNNRYCINCSREVGHHNPTFDPADVARDTRVDLTLRNKRVEQGRTSMKWSR